MACNYSKKICVDQFGCSEGVCPDFRIKRFDTRPSLKINIRDCDGPIDLTNSVVEVSMWAKAKFKSKVAESDTYFAFADNIGFQQSLVGDIIVIADQVRLPEQMLVTGFDESNKLIQVQRSYNGTTARDYKKGTSLKIFRFINAVGLTEMTLQDVEQVDGSTEEDVLMQSKLAYEWDAQDTCLPGCYYLEFKLLKMSEVEGSGMSMSMTSPSVIPSFVSVDADDAGCALGVGVEWSRRFPVDKEGYLIHIMDSPNSESLL